MRGGLVRAARATPTLHGRRARAGRCADAAADVGERTLRQAERAIADTVEHHAASVCAHASAG
jgi:hypothetical protein